jgi:hypothetical protein
MSFLDHRLQPGLAIFDSATSFFFGAQILQSVSTTYIKLSTSCCLSWKATLVPRLHLICCSYNFPLCRSLLDAVPVRLHSVENSRQKMSWSLSTFWLLLRHQLSSWWEIPSFPSMIFVTIDNILDFLSSWTCPCYGWNSPSCLYCVLPWSITVFYVEYVVRIAPPLEILGIVILLIITVPSWSPCWF